MTSRRWLTLAIALCGALAVTAADAAVKKRVAGPIARGCTQQISPACVALVSRGKSYALVGAVPFIPPGIGADVWGTATASPCGPAIQVASWKPNRLRCSR